jgi:phage tail sheath protein FI
MPYGRPGVYISETLLPAPVASPGTANAAGAAIGAFAQGPTTLTLVTSWYDFVKKFGGYNAMFPATFGVNQFFLNGGSELYVKRVIGSGAAAATVTIPSTTTGTNVGTATAKNVGAAGNNLRIRIYTTSNGASFTLAVYQEVVSSELGTANVDASNDVLVESFDNLVFNNATSSSYAATVVNALSQYITLALTDTTHAPASRDVAHVLPLTSGADGVAPVGTDYADVIATDGSSDFDTVERPLIIFAPELYSKFVADANSGADADFAIVADAMTAWAASGTGFAVLDSAPSLTVGAVINYATTRAAANTSQAAVYYPNYYITDPLNASRGILRKVGPASAVTGIYLATDKAVGPFKAPAGVTANVKGAISLERAFTSADLDSLNTGIYTVSNTTTYGTAVNAIRNIPGAGIAVMGARTLLQDGTANKYVNMRRSLIYIEKQLRDLTRFAIFENNDYKLWGRLTTAINTFLNEYSNQGGLRGTTPSQSYFIKVDAQNNTPATIANGEVHIEVGVALQYPSEFVVINLSQITGN